jgi:hypothetical protein
MSIGGLAASLLGQDGQQLRLQLGAVEALLEGVLGQDHVVVDTRGVQHHAAEQLHALHQTGNLKGQRDENSIFVEQHYLACTFLPSFDLYSRPSRLIQFLAQLTFKEAIL